MNTQLRFYVLALLKGVSMCTLDQTQTWTRQRIEEALCHIKCVLYSKPPVIRLLIFIYSTAVLYYQCIFFACLWRCSNSPLLVRLSDKSISLNFFFHFYYESRFIIGTRRYHLWTVWFLCPVEITINSPHLVEENKDLFY